MYFSNTLAVVSHTSLASVFIYQTQTQLHYKQNHCKVRHCHILIGHYMTEICTALLKQWMHIIQLAVHHIFPVQIATRHNMAASPQDTTFKLKWPTFSCTNLCKKKTPLEMHFIYLGKQEIYCNFKTCCIMSVFHFSRKCHLFHYFIYLFIYLYWFK